MRNKNKNNPACVAPALFCWGDWGDWGRILTF